MDKFNGAVNEWKKLFCKLLIIRWDELKKVEKSEMKKRSR